MIDLLFPVLGECLPVDHSYDLYAALSHANPWFHDPECQARFAPINGQPAAPGLLNVTKDSRLRIRLPADQIPQALVLAGKRLAVGKLYVRLGVPQVTQLFPAGTLSSPLVIFKNSKEPSAFLANARRALDDLGIRGEIEIPLVPGGEREGEPRRRVLRIHGKRSSGTR